MMTISRYVLYAGDHGVPQGRQGTQVGAEWKHGQVRFAGDGDCGG